MHRLLLAFGLLSAWPALAQAPSPPAIVITATGEAQAPPDRVIVSFSLRGEGATSDQAVRQLSETERAVRAGAQGLLGGEGVWRAANLSVSEVRAKTCDANNYGRPRLSSGDCAVLGYVALMPTNLETSRIKDAGTLAGLIARLGGADARVTGFSLHDTASLRGQAITAALTTAREEARQIAEASGGRLGPLLRVEDAQSGRAPFAAAAPVVAREVFSPPSPPPIPVEVSPTPIEVSVRLTVTYGIAP
jgi:uncharacterized protein YggE